MPVEQSYATHRRYLPPFHFFVIPVVVINVIIQIVFAVKRFSLLSAWNVVFAIALTALAFLSRIMTLTVQNRLLRLEERLRLERLLPADLRSRVGELSTSQLIALRFCADDEVPELARAVLAGEVTEREEIKKRIKTWRADWLRA
ncbi:MAG TPA: DUF6526 family protein [Thermoanaerobaculia bacterium]|nr:DUF6526 family protein [Thermoanaerobaculia bacterium]